jgi:hypothetical protein
LVLKSISALLGLLLVWLPASAGVEARQSGGIRGRLDIRKLAKPVERRPDAATTGPGGPRDVPDLRPGRRLSGNGAAIGLR